MRRPHNAGLRKLHLSNGPFPEEINYKDMCKIKEEFIDYIEFKNFSFLKCTRLDSGVWGRTVDDKYILKCKEVILTID